MSNTQVLIIASTRIVTNEAHRQREGDARASDESDARGEHGQCLHLTLRDLDDDRWLRALVFLRWCADHSARRDQVLTPRDQSCRGDLGSQRCG